MKGQLTYKVGNLIDAGLIGEVSIIAHCANCMCVMGSGIAPQIKYAFPYAYEADCQTPKGDESKLGRVSIGDPDEFGYDDSGPIVFNLYGQYGFDKRKQGKRDLNYDALYDALIKTADVIESYDKGEQEKYLIGLPKLGSGLAGGDWDIIELIIKKTLCESGHDVTIYVLDEKEIPESYLNEV